MTFYIIIGIIVLFLLIYLFTSRTRVVDLYDKYIKVSNSQNISGKQFAIYAKEKLGMSALNLSLIKGKLTDCYVPKQKTLCLSEEVAESTSIASLAIIAHEFGHAEQHFDGDPLFKLNNLLAKITRITTKFIIPFLLLGIISLIFKWPTENFGKVLLITSAILFAIQVFVKLLIIPVEINASKRALKFLVSNKVITTKETPKVKRLLRTAGNTYIVALFDGILVPLKKIDRKIRR